MYDGTGRPGGAPTSASAATASPPSATCKSAQAKTVLDANGLAVAPGFINMLSWSTDSLIADGRSQGEIRQGVTLEVMGEGNSMGPLTDEMKRRAVEQQGDIRYDITWTTLAEYLAFLEKKGVSTNVASYIGAATIREHVVGLDDRKATPEELEKMRALVRQEMQAGALGIGSSLIYAPGTYASTEELIELSKAAAPYGGRYISHLRSEGDRFLEAVDELITHRARGGRARRDLPPQGGGRVQLAEDGPGHREDRGRAQGGAPHHRRHVHLHRGLHRLRRLHPALVARRRLRRALQAHRRTRPRARA